MKAVLYKRVSTDEQAFGFSLLDQDKRLAEYCHKTGIQIVERFQDDCTGKNFNRPGFTKLLSFIKSKTNKVNQVLFVKWSRFSRNTSDSYQMIKQIRALGIEVQAIDEPIDFSIPQNKIMLAIYLATPEIDNDMRADATIRGMRRSVKEGRYCNGAPYGYQNIRDENNKPLIIQSDKADLIKQAFELYAEGNKTQAEVRNWLKESGLSISRNRFSRMLRDPIYIGKLHLKAWKEEPEQLIKGIHEPIVSEATFYRVQELVTGKSKFLPPRKTQVRDEFPLRGFLYCSCGGKMTASLSKGKLGIKYAYYHCHHPCKTRYKAKEVNSAFEQFLTSIKIDEEIRDIYIDILMETLKDDGSELNRLKKQAEGQSERIKFVQDKFADNQLSFEDFLQMKSRYESALYELSQKITNIETTRTAIKENFNSAVHLLTNLSGYYQESDIDRKREIISSITSGVIYFENENCRTPQINELVRLLSASNDGMHRMVALNVQDVEPGKLTIACKSLSDVFKKLAA